MISDDIQPPITKAQSLNKNEDIAYLKYERKLSKQKPVDLHDQNNQFVTQLDNDEFLCMLCENIFENSSISTETHLAMEHRGYQIENTTETLNDHGILNRQHPK